MGRETKGETREAQGRPRDEDQEGGRDQRSPGGAEGGRAQGGPRGGRDQGPVGPTLPPFI